MNLTPGYRDQIYRVNRAIAQETIDVYKVFVSRDPFSFIFPKQEYGIVNKERGAVLVGER